tara:strand:- start:414 stop:863 length:450 start_codon:yes stop_codon:yes gene_type:complete
MRISLGSIEVTDTERRAIADDMAHLEPVPFTGMADRNQIKAWVTRRLEAMFEDLLDGYAPSSQSQAQYVMVYNHGTNDYSVGRYIGEKLAFLYGHGLTPDENVAEIVSIAPSGSVTVKAPPGGFKGERITDLLTFELDPSDAYWPPRPV